MALQSLGYVGIKTPHFDDWEVFCTRFLGMQLVERSQTSLSLRMDDRKQRMVIAREDGDGISFYGWEVADQAALDGFAAHLESHGIKVMPGSRALADERCVRDLIVFYDPIGNRLEVFHGPATTSNPFRPGRSISGFRTGPLGMGHVVLTAERIEEAIAFYANILGFQLSDYFETPFKAYFFHINPRHHSVAFIETGKNGIHHLMVELCFLDDVGQAYDLALREPARIGTTLGRHVNDHMTSFYSWSPSQFLVEYGWGGRCIDPDTWKPEKRTEGPSLWGHDRYWLSPDALERSRDMRIAVANAGGRVPVNVMDGNYMRAADVCPWWDAAARIAR